MLGSCIEERGVIYKDSLPLDYCPFFRGWTLCKTRGLVRRMECGLSLGTLLATLSRREILRVQGCISFSPVDLKVVISDEVNPCSSSWHTFC